MGKMYTCTYGVGLILTGSILVRVDYSASCGVDGILHGEVSWCGMAVSVVYVFLGLVRLRIGAAKALLRPPSILYTTRIAGFDDNLEKS